MTSGMGTAHDATYEVLRSLGMTTIFGNPGSNETPVSRSSPFRLPVRLGSSGGSRFGDSRWLFSSNRPAGVGQFARSGRGRPSHGIAGQRAGSRDSTGTLMLRRGYIFEQPHHISAMTPHFAQLFGKKPPYGSFAAHVVHCWCAPPSVQ
jgi:hypothetical protein